MLMYLGLWCLKCADLPIPSSRLIVAFFLGENMFLTLCIAFWDKGLSAGVSATSSIGVSVLIDAFCDVE
jgi:hypothetical protein